MPRANEQLLLQLDAALKETIEFLEFASRLRGVLPQDVGVWWRDVVLGMLVNVWCAFLKHAPHGCPFHISPDTIEAWGGWNGPRGEFDALFRLYWVEGTGAEQRLRHWDILGHVGAHRAREAERKRQARSTQGNPSSNTTADEGEESATGKRSTREPLRTAASEVRGNLPAMSADYAAQTTGRYADSPRTNAPNDGESPRTVRGPASRVVVAVKATASPSPPTPDGVGGSFPTTAAAPTAAREQRRSAQNAVQSSHTLLEPRTQAQRAADFAAHLDDLVRDVPHEGARLALRALLERCGAATDRLPSMASRIKGWIRGLGTSGMRVVPWEAMADGFEELLDANPDGQRITTHHALRWAEKARDRREQPNAANGAAGGVITISAAQRADWSHYAGMGDPDYQARCQAHGIPYELAAS